MPLLATLLTSLASGAMGALGAVLTKRAANALLTMGFAGTAAATCFAAVSATLSALSLAVPAGVATPASWIIPAHFGLCVSSVISTEVAVAAYRWTKQVALNASAEASL